MSTKALITADELERMPDDDSVQTELDEGELITMPPAGLDHGSNESEIGFLLHSHVKAHKLGRIYTGDPGFRLNAMTVRAPDVAFVRRERLGTVHGKGFGNGAPDLAVEILSPSDTMQQLKRKVAQYFAAGCHTVWVVDPEKREVHVLEAGREVRVLRGDEVIEAPELLPGFAVPVSAFFEV